MASFNSWRAAATALMLTIISGTAVPVVMPTPAVAQYYRDYRNDRVTIPAGTSIPVRYDKAEKIIVSPTETTDLTLNVATDIVDRNGNVLIPAGTKVVGKLEPATGYDRRGSRFVATDLVFDSGRKEYINATSRVITRIERINRGASTGSILTGAALGAGAAALIAGVTGDHHIQFLDLLGGAGLGAGGEALLNHRKGDVVVIYPNQGDLNLRLRSSLPISYNY